MPENSGAPLPELHCKGFRAPTLHFLQDIEQVGSGDFSDRQFADLWKGIVLKTTRGLLEVIGRPLV